MLSLILLRAAVSCMTCCLVSALTGDVADVIAGGIPNGVPALSYAMTSPTGVAIGENGTILVASSADFVVRQLKDSRMFTLAGSVCSANAGDGGPATLARFVTPFSVVYDAVRNNTYVCDAGGSTVRKIDRFGNITLYAGTGEGGWDGDGYPANTHKLQIGMGMSLDPATGTLFIADSGTNLIRAVLPNNTLVTVVGNTGAGLSPDGTPATSAMISSPNAVAWAPSLRTLFYMYHSPTSGQYANLIGAMAPNNTVYAVAGVPGNNCAGSGDNGPAIAAVVCGSGIAWNNATNSLLIADTTSSRIRQINTSSGVITAIVDSSTPTRTGAEACPFIGPSAVTAASDGTLYIAMTGHLVCQWDPRTNVIWAIMGNGFPGEGGNGQIASKASFRVPTGLAYDAGQGKLFVSGSAENVVRVITANGYIDRYAGIGGGVRTSATEGNATRIRINNPVSMCVEADGSLLVADQSNNVILRVYRNQTVVILVGNGATGFNGDGWTGRNTTLYFPDTLVPAIGAWRFVFADTGNNRVRAVDADGLVRTLAGNGGMIFANVTSGLGINIPVWAPRGVAADKVTGDLYISSAGQNYIWKLFPNGTMVLYAGGGGSTGDFLPPLQASLTGVRQLSFDSVSKVLYFVDAVTSRIRMVKNGNISTVAGVASRPATVCGYAQDVPIMAIDVNFCNIVAMMYEPSLHALFVIDGNQRKVYLISLQRTSDSLTTLSYAVQGTTASPNVTNDVLPMTLKGFLYGLTSVELGSLTCTVESTTWITVEIVCPNTFYRKLGLTVNGIPITQSLVLESGTFPPLTVAWPGGPLSWGTPMQISALGVGLVQGTAIVQFDNSNGVWFSCVSVAQAGANALTCTVGIVPVDVVTLGSYCHVTMSFVVGSSLVNIASETQLQVGTAKLLITGPSPTTISASAANVLNFDLPAAAPSDVTNLCSQCTTCATHGIYLGATRLSCSSLNNNNRTFHCNTPPGVSSRQRVAFKVCDGLAEATSDGLSTSNTARGSDVNAYIYQPMITDISVVLDTGQMSVVAGITGQGLDDLDFAISQITFTSTMDGTTFTCGSIAPTSSTFATCALSSLADLLALFTRAGTRINALSATATAYQGMQQITTTLPAVKLLQAPVIRGIVPSDVLSGMEIAILGQYFTPSTGITVYLGSAVCTPTIVTDTTIICTVPVVSATYSAQYPLFAVRVDTLQPLSSNGLINIRIAADCTLSVKTANYTALPSGLTSIQPVNPSVALTVSGSGRITCTASLAGTSTNCFRITSPSGLVAGNLPSLTQASIVGDTQVASANASSLLLSNLGVSAPGGCIVNLSVTCRDELGRSVESSTSITVGKIQLAWLSSTIPTLFPTSSTETIMAAVLDVPVAITLASIQSSMSCIAGITSQYDNISLPLTATALVASVTSYSVTGNSSRSLRLEFGSVPLASLMLSSWAYYRAECTWLPSSERLRLPSRTINIAAVDITILTNTTMLVPGYTAVSVPIALTTAIHDDLSASGAVCSFGASIVEGIRLSTESSGASYTALSNGSFTPSPQVVLEGVPGAKLEVWFSCVLWGQLYQSTHITFTVANYSVIDVSGASRILSVPSTSAVTGSSLLFPPVSVSAAAQVSLTCVASIASASCPLFNSEYGRGILDVASVSLVGSTSATNTSPEVGNTVVSFTEVAIRSPSGCNLALVIQCTDGASRAALPLSVYVSALNISGAWNASASKPTTLLHGIPSTYTAAVSIDASALPSGSNSTTLSTASISWTCNLGIFRASEAERLDVMLDLGTAVYSATNFVAATSAVPTIWRVDMSGIDCVACTQLVNYSVRTECYYMPTQERIRLPPFNVSYLNPKVSSNMTGGQYTGYATHNASARLFLSTSQSELSSSSVTAINPIFATITVTCSLVQLNASSPLVSVRSVFNDGNPIAVNGASVPYTWQVIGPPLQTLFVRVQCALSNGAQVYTQPYYIQIAPFLVSMSAPMPALPLLPSSRSSLLYFQPVRVTTSASGKVSCTLTVVSSQCTLTLLGTTSLQETVADTGIATLLFSEVAASGPMGCQGSLVATCSDAVGRSNSSSPGLPVYMASWTLEWDTSTLTQFNVPVGLTVLQAVGVRAQPAADLAFPEAAFLVECTSIISTTAMSLPLPKPLRAYVGTALSYGTVTANESTTGAAADFYGLSMEGAHFNSTLYVLSECLWTTSQQVIGTLALPIRTVAPVIRTDVPTAVAVQGYTSQSINVSIDGLVGIVPTSLLPTAICRMVAAQSNSAAVKLQPEAIARRVVSSTPLAGGYSVEGSPDSWVAVAVSCTIWSGVVTSSPFNVSLLKFHVHGVTLPTQYIPSDTNTAWPVLPNAIIRVVDDSQQPTVDVACGLSVLTTVAGVGIFSKESLTNVRSNSSGHVAFPAFSVRGDYHVSSLILKVACTRDSGESMPILTWNASVLPVHQLFCVSPASTQSSQVALPTFSVALTTHAVPGSCAAVAYLQELPPTVCDVRVLSQASLNGNASANASTFFQGTATTPTGNIATFDQFTITAPQNDSFTFSVVCQSGGVTLLPLLTFDVTISGCPAGSEALQSICNKCGGTTFSFGGVGSACVSCPLSGATCTNGILTLLPGFYRPPSQAALEFSADTELHPCLNSEACLVDVEALVYSCYEGYTGPLCSVCDEGKDYVKNINDCRPCWNQGVAAFFVVVAIIVVFSGIAILTLRSSVAHSPATIIFRIAINYLQVIGILRTFTAGGTNVYHNLMGWVDAISSAPLAVSAVQCLFRASFFNQMLFTSVLPLLAALAAALVLAIAFAVRGCRNSSKAAPSSLWSHFTIPRIAGTALIVAFVVYVPITMQSLRALDCYPYAIDGVTYLRTDMQVTCGSTVHQKAQSLGIIMLLLVTCCFPLAIAWGVLRGKDGSVWTRELWSFFLAGYRQSGQQAALAKSAPSSNVAIKALQIFYAALQPSTCVWWECMQLLRKAGIVVAAVTFHTPHVQSVATTCWLLLFLFWQLQEQPYQRRLFNVLDIWAQAACVFTSYVSTTLLEFNAADPTSGANNAKLAKWQWAATVLLLTVNLSTVITFGITWIALLANTNPLMPQSEGKSMHSDSPMLSTKPLRPTSAGVAENDAQSQTINPLRRPSIIAKSASGASISPQRRPSSVPRRSVAVAT